MSVKVNFRVVGLYCSLPNITLHGVTSQSTIKEIMDAIKAHDPSFDYGHVVSNNNKIIVDHISYNFLNGQSDKPYNSSPVIENGSRVLNNQLHNSPVSIWQYYRSITGTINGARCELKLFSVSQPSFSITKLDDNDNSLGTIPEGFVIESYNLTWRLVKIEMHPNQLKNLQTKAQKNTIY